MDQRTMRGQTTREKIVETALRLFAEVGYGAVSIETVLQECEISRGALYHHYASKEVLFEAVLEAAEMRVATALTKAARNARNPLDGLRAGCKAWLRLAATDAVIRRVVLIDAPSVVGWEKWREIDSRYGLGLLKSGLAHVAESGRMPKEMITVYAHILLAVLTEVALMLARSNDAKTVRQGQEAVEQVLSRLVGVEPHGAWTDGLVSASQQGYKK